MNLLLDTHVLLWVALAPTRLSSLARAALADTANTLWVSPISVWEIGNKASRGKLVLNFPLPAFLDLSRRDLRYRDLALTHAHALACADLPAFHRDPADRLLVAQAQVERMAIVSADSAIRQYPVEVLW